MINKNQFTNKNLEFGEFMIDELGLYYDLDGTVYDQENDSPLFFNGKSLVYPVLEQTVIDHASQILFDPLSNPSLSKYLFGFFTNYRSHIPIDSFQQLPDLNNKDKGMIRIESDGKVIVETNNYYNDSLKYADAMMQLNGTDCSNIYKYDAPIVKKRR